jgi:MFS family permease
MLSVPSLLTEPRRPAVVRRSPHAPWFVVGTVCIGAFMGQLDASIVTIALPRIGHAFQAPVGAVEWVALAYLLTLIATVAIVGHFADAIGRKLLYTYGFAAFTASSALCGLAPSLPVLIAARVLQALGAAMLQANSVALITEAMPRHQLKGAIGVQGTAQALGLALGPALGGALLAVGGWRLIFMVNVPAGVVGLALGWVLLPRSRSRRRIGHVDLRLLRLRSLQVGLSSGLLSFMILFGALFVVPYYFSAHHVPAAVAGLELAVLPVGIGVAAALAGRLRLPHPTATGMVLTGAGLLVAALVQGTAPLLAGLLLAGLGLGAFTPSNNAAIMSAAPSGFTGLVSGLLNMTRGAGTALGVAVAGALYTAGAGHQFTLTMGALAAVALLVGAALQLDDTREQVV